MFADDGVVAHAGEVIADTALETVFGDHGFCKRPQVSGMGLIVPEEFLQQSCGTLVRL